MIKINQLFISIFLISACNAIGQDSKWGWGVMIMPEYSFKTIADSKTIEGDQLLGLCIQPTLSADLTDGVEIISGVLYDYSHISYKDYSLIFSCDWNGFGFNERASYMKYRVEAHSLGLPIHVKWNFFAQESTAYVKFGYNQLFTVASNKNQNFIECRRNRPIPEEYARQINDIRGELELGLGLEVAHQKQYKLLLEIMSSFTINGFFERLKPFDTVRFLDLGVRMGVLFY